jgi:hypothetical protein
MVVMTKTLDLKINSQCRDTRHDDTQPNAIQHYGLIATLSMPFLSYIIFNTILCYSERAMLNIHLF